MDELDELRLIATELHAGLDTLPYHVFLGVLENTEGEALRAAFHARAQKFHPDRFHSLADKDLRGQIYAVYKRITEAYRVLSDPDARKRYDEQRQRGLVRLQPERADNRAPEDQIMDLKARRFFKEALEAEKRGDVKTYKMNLEFARQLAPGDPVIAKKIKGS